MDIESLRHPTVYAAVKATLSAEFAPYTELLEAVCAGRRSKLEHGFVKPLMKSLPPEGAPRSWPGMRDLRRAGLGPDPSENYSITVSDGAWSKRAPVKCSPAQSQNTCGFLMAPHVRTNSRAS